MRAQDGDEEQAAAADRLARILARPAPQVAPAAGAAEPGAAAPGGYGRGGGYDRGGGYGREPAGPGGGHGSTLLAQLTGTATGAAGGGAERPAGELAELGEPAPAEPDAEPSAAPAGAPGRTLARLAGGAFDPGRPGVRALAAVAVVVVLAAGGLAWWSRPRPEPVVPQLASTTLAPPSPSASAPLVVAVTGQVREPGLVELPPGSRVADAIEAAGGLLPEAEIDHLNLARKLTDGELVAVGVEPPPEDAGGGTGSGGPGPAGKINLNTATTDQLQALPGIGPALAQRIIDYRTANGPFTAVGQLREVSGIGDTRFADLRELVTV